MMSASQHEVLVGGHDTVNAVLSRHRIRTLQRIGFVLLSAGLLTCSLPGPDLGWLAWIALVPLVMACDGITPLQAAALGFLSGSAANVGMYHWLFGVKGFGPHHFVVLSTFFALYLAAWCAGLVFLTRRRAWLLFTVPALWVVLDYVRAHAGFMAFPWGTLAQTQHHDLAILQIATLTGEYGVTFLVVLGNVALAGIILQRNWRNAAVIGLAIALVHVVGAFSLLSDPPGKTIRVAAVQPSILLGQRNTAAGRAVTWNRLIRLTRAATASSPSLIAWPETAVAGPVRGNPLLAADVMALAQEMGIPLVFGVGEVEKFATRDSQGNLNRRAYNAAYVVTPEQGWEAPYIKRVLLPFGEYVPLERFIGWPAWLAPPMFHTVVGNQPRAFTLDDGTPFAPLICWENLFADLVRESVQGGARFLVLLTNDGWFGRTAEPDQHNLASVLRAIENRVPIVVASNTGPSQIIDAYGRVVAQAPRLFSEDIVIGDVKLGSAGTLYTRIGDAFLFIVMGVLALVVIKVCLDTQVDSVHEHELPGNEHTC